MKAIALSLVLILTGCVAANHTAQTQNMTDTKMWPIPNEQHNRLPVGEEPQVFVQVRNYAVGAGSELERENLQQLSAMLRQAYNLSLAAQQSSNDLSRIKFDYATLQLDLQAITFGLSQYLQTDYREVRFPTQINARPIHGDYLRVRN